jgi:hypothetical protein
MANTLTGLIPTLYDAMDVVSREQIGFIPAVTRDVSGERAALNESILVPITTPPTLGDNTPAVTAPNDGDSVIGNAPILITRSKYAPVRWNGEETKGLLNAGTYNTILRDRFIQAFRALGNLMEQDLFNVAYQNASRATGTAGTAPFSVAADLSAASNLRQILDDNGAPQSDLQLVLGSAAVNNLRGKQSILLKANENGAGGADFRMTGNISSEPLIGFNLHNSFAVAPVASGTGAGYATSGSTAAGVSSIVLATGTGTVLAGDAVGFAGDNNVYMVNGGVTAPGAITIGNPGAEGVIASGSAMTITSKKTPNVGFARSAIVLVARPPAMPIGPNGEAMDMADDMMDIVDPVSGMTYTITVYRQFMQLVYHVSLAWGVSAIKSEHIAVLLG